MKNLFQFSWFIKLSHFSFSYGSSHQLANCPDVSSLEYWMSIHYNIKDRIILITSNQFTQRKYNMAFKDPNILYEINSGGATTCQKMSTFFLFLLYHLLDLVNWLYKVIFGLKSWEGAGERSQCLRALLLFQSISIHFPALKSGNSPWVVTSAPRKPQLSSGLSRVSHTCDIYLYI